jgi:acyl-coenzyme A thioesterase PaaI-like protein
LPGGYAILIGQVRFPPKDPNFDARVRASFAQQNAMRTLGVEIVKLEPGEVEFSMPYSANFTQQNGYIHAGIITTALDSACGYAAFSLMPANAAVLTVEFKTTYRASEDRAIHLPRTRRKARTYAHFLRGPRVRGDELRRAADRHHVRYALRAFEKGG